MKIDPSIPSYPWRAVFSTRYFFFFHAFTLYCLLRLLCFSFLCDLEFLKLKSEEFQEKSFSFFFSRVMEAHTQTKEDHNEEEHINIHH